MEMMRTAEPSPPGEERGIEIGRGRGGGEGLTLANAHARALTHTHTHRHTPHTHARWGSDTKSPGLAERAHSCGGRALGPRSPKWHAPFSAELPRL